MIKYIDEFRNPVAIKNVLDRIRSIKLERTAKLMEVCGGHTLTIMKYGLHQLLPQSVKLISGPGCPVCVTPINYIDSAIELAKQKDTIVTSFGDMLRVPGTYSSLIKEKSNQNDIRIVLSPMNALQIAKDNPNKEVVFLGIGFETTIPSIGITILNSVKQGVKNFSVLTAIKTMPEAMEALVNSDDIDLQGFICPGHVSAIAGTSIYNKLASYYKKPCVVSGFEPIDLLETIEKLLQQIQHGESKIEIQYNRVVKPKGNIVALETINKVFTKDDVDWRGIGVIPGSGLKIKDDYSDYDAKIKFNLSSKITKENPQCICGDIMRGVKTPNQCKLFAKACTPDNPIGACMVSAEGACGIYYKYH